MFAEFAIFCISVTLGNMNDPQSKLDLVQGAQDSSSPSSEPVLAGEIKNPQSSRKRNSFADPKRSEKKGALGFAETFLRRFQLLSYLALSMPIYALACLVLGAAVAPALASFDFLSGYSVGQPALLKYFILGASAVASYLVYGFSLVFLSPTVTFLLRAYPKPWRGPYYSLEAIRWFIHNGATYVVRFTFLEFITPTPFSLMFYRMMGMKIGRGTTINTTWISDPAMIELGDKVTLGGSVTLIGHYGQGGYLVLAPTKIGDRVTIGIKATIMGGVTIGEDAKVLPMSVVLPKTVIPAGEIWGGVPARKMDL